jgi:ATP dependent DNA ligase domain
MSLPKNALEIIEFAEQGIIDDSILKMPTLWNRHKTSGKFEYWQVFVGIADRSLDTDEIENDDNEGTWEESVEWFPVTEEFIKRGEIPDESVGVLWTRSGQEGGKETVSKPTFLAEGKGIAKDGKKARSNYTTAFTQATRDAMTKYNFKVKKGSVIEAHRSKLKSKDDTYDIGELAKMTHRGDSPWRVYVMLLHDYNKGKNARHIKFPCYIQEKLNGTHFVAVSHSSLPTVTIVDKDRKVVLEYKDVHLDFYTRGREKFEGQEHILTELYPILAKYPGLHVTGELYKKGVKLQDVSGSSRRIKKTKNKSTRAAAIKLELHVFDVFYINKPKMPFSERYDLMNQIFQDLESLDYPIKYIKRIPTFEVDSKEQLDTIYRSFIDEGKEGGVVRNSDSSYELGVNKANRSYQTMKMKPREDSEFPIIGYTDGNKGKSVGAVKWICTVRDEDAPGTNLEERDSFDVDPNWTYELRYAIYKALEETPDWFEENIKGQLATIEFAEFSKDMKPQQPKFIQFRDSKLEQKVAKLAGVDPDE